MQQVGTARLERKYRGSRGVYFSKTEDRAVLRGISPGAKYALDLGTGAGRFAFLLAGCAEFAIGVDIRIDGLEVAKDRIPEGTRVAFANMEGATLGFRSESFDLVTAVGTFECTQDLRPILREVARVLAAGGYVIFTCWNEARWPKLELLDRRVHGSVLWSPEDVRVQTEQCGLTVVGMESIFFVPRRLLWWSYRSLLIEPLRRILIARSVSLEERCSQSAAWAMAGRVLVVRAKKARVNEVADQHR